MNRLIWRWPLMDEAGDGTGGDTGTGTGTGTGSDTATGGGDGDKPFLGDEGDDGDGAGDNGGKSDDPDNKGDNGDTGDTPKVFEEKDFLAALKKDEALLGNDPNSQLDQTLVKAVVPILKEIGVTPEQANKLANAVAKAQLDQGREMMRERVAYFKAAKEEAIRKYSKSDFAQIRAGIGAHFKKGGVMDHVIRNSELGADPEFLALMHELGAKHMTDTGTGAASGGGDSGGEGNTFAGISSIWK